MKKLIKALIVIICLICLAVQLGILDFSNSKVSYEKISSYSNYYYNKLHLEEKEMYVKIDEAVKTKKKKVILGRYKDENLSEKATRAMTAYFYDNPEYYYISNQYVISIKDFISAKRLTINLEYIIETNDEIAQADIKFQKAVDKFINENITESMTDFEKEVAIHDALVKNINYYEYQDINKIPAKKHTAYSALVEKEAVCDGYSKAFKVLLDKVGIESVIVSGDIEGTPHAWNMVKLDNKYYHVDVTSDKIEDRSNKYVIHKYFNVTDEAISKTHTLDAYFEYPISKDEEYNYYIKNEYYLRYYDFLSSKLEEIASKQKDSKILEIKSDNGYSVRQILDALYDLNFGNWRSDGKTSVTYNNLDDIYIFVK